MFRQVPSGALGLPLELVPDCLRVWCSYFCFSTNKELCSDWCDMWQVRIDPNRYQLFWKWNTFQAARLDCMMHYSYCYYPHDLLRTPTNRYCRMISMIFLATIKKMQPFCLHFFLISIAVGSCFSIFLNNLIKTRNSCQFDRTHSTIRVFLQEYTIFWKVLAFTPQKYFKH